MKISHLHLQYWFFKKNFEFPYKIGGIRCSQKHEISTLLYLQNFSHLSHTNYKEEKKLLLNPSFRNNIDGNKVDKHCYTTFLKTG